MHMHSRWRLLALILGCLIVFGACDLGTSTATVTTTSSGSSPSGGGSTSTPTSGSTSTPSGGSSTPVPSITPCSTIVSGYGPASGGSMFGDVPFPANSSSTSVTLTHAGNSYKFAIYGEDVCTAGSGSANVRSFFAAHLPATGFLQSTTFPFDGLFEAPCGDPYCWASPHGRYVGLEAVTDHGNGLVTYHLRFAFPPTAPSCPGSGWSSGYYYKLPAYSTYTDVELPPLTRIRVHQPTMYEPTYKKAYDWCSPFVTTGEGNLISWMSAHGGWGPVSPGLNFVGPQGTILVGGDGSTYYTFYFE